MGSALPGRRVELYQKICDLLLGSRQEAKGIKTPLTGEQYKLVLQVLALALMERKTREFTPEVGEELIKDKLRKVAGDKLTPSKFLEQIKKLCGLLVERELGVYEFAHLSFQEYLAAAQVEKLQEDKILLDNLNDSWWAETIRLYAAQGNATNLIEKAIENPTINSLSLALDCLEVSLEVEPEIREKLELMLEEGLESSDEKIAKSAAEVKLSRRLKNLREIDENLEIDVSYISCAEYQLFVEEKLNLQERFSEGGAKKPITNISWEDALNFCAWLSSKDLLQVINYQEVYYYRLPTAAEIENHQAQKYKKLQCLTIGGDITTKAGIRVVRNQLSPDYAKLVNYLASGEWEEADRETQRMMLKFTNQVSEGELDADSIGKFPAVELFTIDQLWLVYSGGWFGFGVQASIWENIKLNQSTKIKRFTEIIGWDNGQKIRYELDDAPAGHLPCVWWLNSSEKNRATTAFVERFIACKLEKVRSPFKFDVITVNTQGQEIKRKQCQAKYFTEDLGNCISLDMVVIPGGEFMMGSPEGEGDNYEKPQHEVAVSSFYMGKFQVTQGQWKAVAGLPKIKRKLEPEPSYFKGENRPVEQVSWNDAVEFCVRLSKYTGREYRLPSEAEWEYACRAGTLTPFHFGQTITTDLANYYSRKVDSTTPVGKFPANAFGLHDMHGNVWEWCFDDWHSNYEGAPTDGSAWTKNENDNRSYSKVLRGGSWLYYPVYCRSACRSYDDIPEYRDDGLGFRVVCAVAQRILQ